MLDPITRKMADTSDKKRFSFSFYCDVCQRIWESVPMEFSAGKQEAGKEKSIGEVGGGLDPQSAALWEKEHEAAYERANREAMLHFNRCPVCKRWVCDDCFHMREDGDACSECNLRAK